MIAEEHSHIASQLLRDTKKVRMLLWKYQWASYLSFSEILLDASIC